MSELSFEDHSLEGPFELIFVPPIILPVDNLIFFYIYLIKVDGVKKCVHFIFRKNHGILIPFPSEFTDGIKRFISNPSIPLFTDKIIRIINQLQVKYGTYRLVKERDPNVNYNSWNEHENGEIEKPGISLFYLISNLDDMVKFVSGLRRKFSNTANNVNRLSNRYILYNDLLNTFWMRMQIGTFKMSNKSKQLKEFINSHEIKEILQLFRRVSNRSTNIELIRETTNYANATLSRNFLNESLKSVIRI
jgi:hypothetical protein